MKKKVWNFKNHVQFLASPLNREIVFEKGERVFLLNTPEHGNLGDQAIVYAEKRWVNKNYPGKRVIEIPHNVLSLERKKLRRKIQKDDILLMQGGGYVGTLWELEQQLVNQVLQDFAKNEIIFFLQTIFFETLQTGKDMEKKFCTFVDKCEDITFVSRDRKSYEWCKEKFGTNCKCLYTPDMVTILNFSNKPNANEKGF